MKSKMANLIRLILLAPIAVQAGTVSSGGDPRAPAPPSEAFEYICNAVLSEQINSSGKTCYTEALNEYKAVNSDMRVDGMLAPVITIETSNDGWHKGHSWDGCPTLPSNIVGNLISITFGRDDQNKSTVGLDVRLLRNTDNEYLYSTSDVGGSFSDKSISANTEFYHQVKTDGKITEDRAESLRVICNRTK